MAVKVATFQSRFASLFDESEKTTTQLAKELHVSNQTISAWKTGTRSPKEPTILSIARYFGVTVEWLMGFNVKKEADVAEEKKREFTIFVPSKNFVKMTTYMTQEDYENVVKAFERAYEKMKELGVSLDD